MSEYSFHHWKLETDRDNILWLTLDREGKSVNSLSREVFAELDQVLDIINQQSLRGLVLLSGKNKGFIAGADISEFTDLKTSDDAFELIRRAQVMTDRIAALKIPTVAMINGFCMGGGTELALSCRYRVAEESASTLIGLPEIQLGIQPGWGGTVRLPRLIGPIEAMKMILAGASYPAKKCAKIGIVDVAVPARHLRTAARDYILTEPKPKTPPLLATLLNVNWIRPWVGKLFYKNLRAAHVSREHYPAPFAVVDNWIKFNVDNHDEAMIAEAKSISNLMLTETARNLVRLFFLRDKMKGLAKNPSFKPKHIHVVGAGTMGGDIAAWSALQGFHVTLQDQVPERIAPAIKRAYELFTKKLKDPRLVAQVMDRLQPDVEGNGVTRADVIIEAIFENLEAKQALFKSFELKIKPGAILASNTSTLPLEDIASVLKNPANLVGIHFFNPVAKMQLVEVVRGKLTSDEVVNKALAFVGQIHRLPLPVTSFPGFLINRILMPYLMEAFLLYQEKVPMEQIDQAAVQFGMPMGPIALADVVGLDICYSAALTMGKYFGLEVPAKLKEMVDAKKLGVKSGQGFYQYRKGKKISSGKKEKVISKDITERLILRMVNEAVACLHEGIVADADLLDAGMIFGTGFAPFRGGPIQYAKNRGVTDVVASLEKLAHHYGDRFKPYPGWELLLETTGKLLTQEKSNA
jgi:3-hydroxyacyl-CoA dehydrogenase/enoyl-CoA hydratase/3-hydroxybutyryl-CoA epimerase